MGTSATYTIGNNKFYTHYDGYEIGVAYRFLNAIKAMTKVNENSTTQMADVRGGFAFALIRGNNDIEPNQGIVGDYNYEVSASSNGEIVVEVSGGYAVDLAEFVNSFYKGSSSDEIVKVKLEGFNTSYIYARKADAYDIGVALMKKAEKFSEDNPNKANYEKKSRAFLNEVM